MGWFSRSIFASVTATSALKVRHKSRKRKFEMINVLRNALLAMMACVITSSIATAADDYPNRPIKLIVPFAPGGGSDMLARIISEPLRKRLGQPIIIDNKPGAGGSLGAGILAKSAPDGYTLMYMTPGTQMINPYLMKVPYDAEKDFAPVSKLGIFPNILVINPKIPATNVRELVAYAKAHPGALNFGSTGIGSSSHLSGELFKANAGVNIIHVPYKGTAAVVQDLVAGNIQMTIDAVSTYLPYIKAGTLRAIAMGTAERLSLLPDLPTIAEDFPGFDSSALNYLSVPAGTPAAIIERLNREVVTVLDSPDIRERMLGIGVIPQKSSPKELDQTIRNETKKWRKVIETSGAKAE
jgi:tripartite-type tricarboxylate transporter receptor subunit TctC